MSEIISGYERDKVRVIEESNKKGKSTKIYEKRFPKEIEDFVKWVNTYPNSSVNHFSMTLCDKNVNLKFTVNIQGQEYKVEILLSEYHPFSVPVIYMVTIGEDVYSIPNVYKDTSLYSNDARNEYEVLYNKEPMIMTSIMGCDNWNPSASIFLPFKEFHSYRERMNEFMNIYIFILLIKEKNKCNDKMPTSPYQLVFLNEDLVRYMFQWL